MHRRNHMLQLGCNRDSPILQRPFRNAAPFRLQYDGGGRDIGGAAGIGRRLDCTNDGGTLGWWGLLVWLLVSVAIFSSLEHDPLQAGYWKGGINTKTINFWKSLVFFKLFGVWFKLVLFYFSNSSIYCIVSMYLYGLVFYIKVTICSSIWSVITKYYKILWIHSSIFCTSARMLLQMLYSVMWFHLCVSHLNQD